MKKVTLALALFGVIILWSCGGSEEGKESSTKVEIIVQKDSYKPGEKDALIVLKAYADNDLETLKSYAGSTQRMVMKDDFFENNSFIKGITHWNGSFKEIRYYKEEINFKNNYYLNAIVYESPDSDQLTVLKLKSADKKLWKLSGFGTAFPKKDEFNQMSLEIPE